MADRRHMIQSAELDHYFPPAGPCAFCGHVDRRHRLWDALMARPESDLIVALEYYLPLEAVRLVRTLRPYRRRHAA